MSDHEALEQARHEYDLIEEKLSRLPEFVSISHRWFGTAKLPPVRTCRTTRILRCGSNLRLELLTCMGERTPTRAAPFG